MQIAISPAQPLPLANLLGLLLLGSVLGAALQLQQPELFELLAYAVLAAGSLALLVVLVALLGFQLFRAQGTHFWLCAGLTFMLAGGVGFGATGLRAHAFLATALNPALEGQDILVTGQIKAMPQVSEDGVRFYFEVASADLDGKPVAVPPRLLLGWYAGFGTRPAKTLVDTARQTAARRRPGAAAA